MAFTNFDTKEINCKILFFGPKSAGKTENLKSILKNTSQEIKTGMVELDEEGGPTRFFDFLPISLGHVKDFHLKLHLFTLPTNSLYESVGSVILKGMDGFIFIADSRVEAMAANIECLTQLRKLLAEEGFNVADLPKVFQYNKRDLSDVMSVEVMRNEMNPGAAPDFKAIANQSVGTMESLQAMAKLVLKRIAP